MPKYLLRVSYTAEGARGVMKDGGSKRRSVVKDLTEKAGGKLECFYYAFGESDAYLIVDLPNHATMLAVSMAVCAAGGATISTTVLVPVEDVDSAAKMSIGYRPPGA